MFYFIRKKTISVIFLILTIPFIGAGFWYFKYQYNQVSNIKKEISELKIKQNEQNKNINDLKQYIDDLIIFDWESYFKKDIVSFRYPEFASLCDNSSDEKFELRLSLRGNCKRINKPEDGTQNSVYDITWDDFVFKIIYKQKDIKSAEDVLKMEGMRESKKIKTSDWKNMYPDNYDFLTEWYSEKNNDTYMAIILYPPDIGNPIIIVKSSNYKFWPINKPIIDLIIQSIRFP